MVTKKILVVLSVVICLVLIIVFTGYFGTRVTETASCTDIGGNCQLPNYESGSGGCGYDVFGSELTRLNGTCLSEQICCSKDLGKGSEPEHKQASAESIVFISGVENGECVVPSVNLWSRPGDTDATVSGRVSGCTGLPVKVVETRYISPRRWYHVQTYGANAGKDGWVTESFIKE